MQTDHKIISTPALELWTSDGGVHMNPNIQ